MQSGTSFGLTGCLHNLNSNQTEHRSQNEEIGNDNINQDITEAIIKRKIFRGWRGSSIETGP